MLFHVFGNMNHPAILCMHGMLQDWRTEYEFVKPLEKDFCLILPAMDGMYPESPVFTNFAEQCRQMEIYLKENFGGHIRGVYGCSQGATVLSELLARNRVRVDVAVLDAIYLAHQGKLAAWFGYTVFQKVKKNGGKFPKTMAIPMKLMGLDEDDYGMFEKLYWDVSDLSMKNNLYENYTYRVNPAIKGSETSIHLWCGEKEPYALKSHRILKQYISCSEEKIFPGMGHGQMLLKQPKAYFCMVKEAMMLPD